MIDSKKEDFLNQLQYELGHIWPETDSVSIITIEDLAVFIAEKEKVSKWRFLRFLPFYNALKDFLKKEFSIDATVHFDLNTLNKAQKAETLGFIKKNFAEPLTLKRPETIHTIVYILPIVFILLPLLFSTFLVTSKDYSGWIYLSGLVGLGITYGAFELTVPLKNRFHPSDLLGYAKAFYVVHNQTLTNEASQAQLQHYLCDAAERYYKQPLTVMSEIPTN